MNSPQYFVGIDIAAEEFTASIFYSHNRIESKGPFQNSLNGFQEFERWLKKQSVKKTQSAICMEATGVYGEKLCYWLNAKEFKVAVEPPLKVKRAFESKGHKNDKLDSRQIAEYAFRYCDELKWWKPKSEIIEHIKILLATREQFVGQKTADLNALKALHHKVVQTHMANNMLKKNIKHLTKQIEDIEKEIQKFIDQDPDFKQTVSLLKTIPGVALLLSANLLVVTNGFSQEINYKQLAAYIGICPYEHTSGKTVRKRSRSVRYGPARLRKLLHLAARSVKTHKKPFQFYYLKKCAQGKASYVILNNISNKLLKIICAIIKSQKPYLENYKSINPSFMA